MEPPPGFEPSSPGYRPGASPAKLERRNEPREMPLLQPAEPPRGIEPRSAAYEAAASPATPWRHVLGSAAQPSKAASLPPNAGDHVRCGAFLIGRISSPIG